jgi:putative SOS response-associated peptidase YedK
MCGRYSLYDLEELGDRFDMGGRIPDIEPNFNAAPGQFMPIITAESGTRELRLMKWGFVPHWAKNISMGYKMINTRAESVFDKPAWRGAILHHRCLVPARGFYEWKRVAGKTTKQPYYIHPEDQDIFAFAGIWSLWNAPDGSELDSFSIMTTTPNRELSKLHDRMPVILNKETESIWLDKTLEDKDIIAELLKPYPDGHLEMFPVSQDVNITRNNDNYLVFPLNSQ